MYTKYTALSFVVNYQYFFVRKFNKFRIYCLKNVSKNI
jgi:hypothetical protein